ncbi:MAG: GNAT family N-acetyltransferase [Spirochaetales bacterium]|uniref:GNAT family N-acetyltransferase n=1 Tax=Candidatus Thalassospirochaeta sargassi TaxID=3119039 RepID=A0AAJ1MNG7_9SPIO|nr:GNAT family N-acetyltransferase [Spirochaetales bacterium]
MELHISELSHSEIGDYCALVREVFDEFVAPDYPEDGNRTFYEFMSKEKVHERMHTGALTIAAKSGGGLVGACAFRDLSHLSTFFVKKEFQGRGVGRMMLAYGLRKIRAEYPDVETVTVNSSPFAVAVYKRLGFRASADRQQKDGIIFYPMEYPVRFYA